MTFKELLEELDRQENDLIKLKDDSSFDKQLNKLILLKKEANDFEEEINHYAAKELDEEKVLGYKEKVYTEEETSKLMDLTSKLVELRKEADDLEVTISNQKLEKDGKVTEFRSSISHQRRVIKKAIDIQNIGLDFYFLAFLYLVAGIITTLQLDYFYLIQNIIEETDNVLKMFFLLALLALIEGTIIYTRSINDAEKLLDTERKKTIFKVIKFPNFLEWGLIMLITIYLFFPNLVGVLLKYPWGIVCVNLVHTFFIALFFLQIKSFIFLMVFKFKKSIEDPKDRLGALVAIVGTVISLIALFK